MKTFCLFLFLSLSLGSSFSAGAGTFSEGTAEPREPFGYELERITFKKTLFLDRRTFDSNQLDKINIENRYAGLPSIYKTLKIERAFTQTHEGLFIRLKVTGPSKEISRFFDREINIFISSAVNKGGWRWRVPTDPYISYWSSIFSEVQREIRNQAFVS